MNRDNTTDSGKVTQDVDNKKATKSFDTKRPDNVVTLPTEGSASCDYDIDMLTDFLDTVFHAGLAEGENVLCYSAKSNVPVYPISEESLLKTLTRSHRPLSCYYGTATTRKDVNSGELFNRQGLFISLRVVVLDDIGTKIPLDALPEDLEPTYIIESSPNNFQYGYVLENPIEDLAQAKALIKLIYGSGVTDGGGAMPNKLVRLPVGVNGKAGPNKMFPVTLTKSDGPRWTPNALLEILNTGTTWEQIEQDAENAVRSSRLIRDASQWSNIQPRGAALSGVIDPVYEYLIEENLVKEESGDWVAIECPWAHTHTSGSSTASYSPLGYGEAEYIDQRSFNCFHDHCKDKTTADFLTHIAAESGIEVPVYDLTGELSRNYVYDKVADVVHKISGSLPLTLKRSGFNTVYGKKLHIQGSDGKVKSVTQAAHWLASPHTVYVAGKTSDFSTPARIVTREDENFINTARVPAWGDGAFKQDHIDTFMGFVEYLIPDDSEREYFLDWLAAKTQDLTFRGCAILMIADEVQGIGRTTLGDMIRTLFGTNNVSTLPLSAMVNSTYNEWQEGLLTITDETLSTAVAGGDSQGPQGMHRVYEALKDVIDPRPKMVTINEKYGTQRQSLCVTSSLLFSNHANAVATAKGDRRIYVIRNPQVPMDSDGFVALNAWLSTDAWALSVWRWLRKRKVDIGMLTAPAPMTEAKIEMAAHTQSYLNAVITGLATAIQHDGLVPIRAIKAVVNDHRIRHVLRLGDDEGAARAKVSAAMRRSGINGTLPTAACYVQYADDGSKTKWTCKVFQEHARSWAGDLSEARKTGKITERMKNGVIDAVAALPTHDEMVAVALEILDDLDNM